MTDAEYKELFSNIDPLDKTKSPEEIISEFDLPNHLKISLENHYSEILNRKYINPKKIQDSITFLNHIPGGDNILEKAQYFFYNHERPLYKKAKDLHFGDTYFFWVYETSAFLFLNEYLNNKDNKTMDLVIQFFARSEMYKDAWGKTKHLINGGLSTKPKSPITKRYNFVYGLWRDNFAQRKGLSDNEAFDELKRMYNESKKRKPLLYFYAKRSFIRNDSDNILKKFRERYDAERRAF